MELLFRAAELETSTIKHTSTHLTVMSLAQVLQHSIPLAKQSPELDLDVVLPQQLPTVVSDPTMLDQVLRFNRKLHPQLTSWEPYTGASYSSWRSIEVTATQSQPGEKGN